MSAVIDYLGIGMNLLLIVVGLIFSLGARVVIRDNSSDESMGSLADGILEVLLLPIWIIRFAGWLMMIAGGLALIVRFG